jgi:hypothetical protein
LTKEEDVELIECSSPSKEIEKIKEKFNTDKYDVVIKGFEDMRTSTMDVIGKKGGETGSL